MAKNPNLATKLHYGEIFEHNHVSPVLIGVQPSGSTGIANPASLKKSDPSPIFIWTIPIGSDGKTQLLNRFGIKIFDAAGTVVYDSGTLPVGTTNGTIQISGVEVRFAPKLVNWQTKIISRVGSAPATFRWVAYGGFYGDETLQTDILTGEYWSSTGEFNVVP